VVIRVEDSATKKRRPCRLRFEKMLSLFEVALTLVLEVGGKIKCNAETKGESDGGDDVS
jgi:hypothetical protein